MVQGFKDKDGKFHPTELNKKGALSSDDIKMFGKKGKFKPIGDEERRGIDQKLQDAQQVIRAMGNGHSPHQKNQIDFVEKKLSSVRRQINRVGT